MAGSDPVVQGISLDLPEPALGDNRSHEARLRLAIAERLGIEPGLPLRVNRMISKILPASGYRVNCLLSQGPCGWEIIDVAPKDQTIPAIGLAVDLGSTTVVFYLVDLARGEILSQLSVSNPQRIHGEDILERILFAGRKDGLRTLQKEITGVFNETLDRLATQEGLVPENISYISVAGNTTMCHFLLDLDPSNICKEPYIPSANRFDLIRPAEVGIKCHPGAWLYCFPNVGSYFGGDLLSGILASGMHKRSEISMLIDVGTNAEVVLGNNEWMVACAGAAGPALEGGILSCGMRAQDGAIERISIDPKTLEPTYSTIGNLPPRGMCGSAIIDLLAEMFVAGLVDQTGKLIRDKDPKRMRQINGELAYVVADEDRTGTRPIYISQSDIKNLIRSKGAMYTILNVIIQSVGISFEDIDRFYVAGAFGNYIDPSKAITIGMLPDVPIDRFSALGNAAGKGAVQALLKRSSMKEVEEICEKITYLEMNVRGDFMGQLTGALFLPHTDLSRFPTVRRLLGL